MKQAGVAIGSSCGSNTESGISIDVFHLTGLILPVFVIILINTSQVSKHAIINTQNFGESYNESIQMYFKRDFLVTLMASWNVFGRQERETPLCNSADVVFVKVKGWTVPQQCDKVTYSLTGLSHK
jgi:hypothetical protein